MLSNIKSKTYNRALTVLPAHSARFTGTFRAVYDNHALRAARDDRYGQIFLPQTLDIEASQIVEVETVNNRAVKAVARLPYNDKLDLVLVICDPMDGEIYVKTVWLNQRDDNHATLRTEKLQHV